ncbi:MAG: hypothetical protein Q9227_007011 [Pyrenula ochraceoflavens]
MDTSDVPKPSLCERCSNGLFSREGWGVLDHDSVVSMVETERLPWFRFEATADELILSVSKNCWWCELIYDGLLRWTSNNDPDCDIFEFDVFFEKPPTVHPVRVHVLSVQMIAKTKNSFRVRTAYVLKLVQVGFFSQETVSSLLCTAQGKSQIRGSTNTDTACRVIEAQEQVPNFSSSIARRWLRECEERHTECAVPGQQHLPSRVIDVLGAGGEPFVRLICCEEPQIDAYVFLSYRWGGTRSLMLKGSHLEQWQDKLSLDSLPQTLKDAVKCTRSLDDLHKELRRMSDYIRYATLVLQPSGVTSVYDSFFAQSPVYERFHTLSSLGITRYKHMQVKIPDRNDSCRSFVLEASPHWYRPLDEPIHSRGWVFQERLLCPRVLIFPSTGGMIWQCEMSEISSGKILYGDSNEQNRHRLSRNAYRLSGGAPEKRTTPSEIHESWLALINDYTQRDLTYPNDKLVAVAALASFYADRYGNILGKYCAGVWYNFLYRSLHWQYCGQYNGNPKSKPKQKRAPSWSWAAADNNEVLEYSEIFLDSKIFLEVIACDIYLVSDALPFGQVTGGTLTISGKLVELIWYPDRWTYDATLYYFRSSDMVDSLPKTPPDWCFRFGRGEPDFLEYRPTQPKKVTLLPIFPEVGLLLQRQETNGRLESEVFVRVGICKYEWQGELFKDRERRIIVIE